MMTGYQMLLPCPFCGGDAEVLQLSGGSWIAYCNTPFCARLDRSDTAEEAIEKWNRRDGATGGDYYKGFRDGAKYAFNKAISSIHGEMDIALVLDCLDGD